MSELSERIQGLSPKRLALVALELEERLERAERGRNEAIAIVGMACRLPGGASTPEAFWELLDGGVDAIREVPAERWDVAALYDPDPDRPGTMSTRWGGFIDGCDRFDPGFFGISPREAQTMDPQQRLLLEVSWEALERSGISADRLHASPSGVFVGLCNSDYMQLLLSRDRDTIDTYLASGTAFSVASGRIAYLLGLQGPAISVDTACSSSLVAVHLACQSLRVGECRLALAGGVNLMLAPETTIALSKGHMMAPDGRCKTFDAAADGFVRGEGCGVVVLKRLSDAEADGDRILAVIRGSAINQDGRSSGLTAPNGPSQEAVIRAALAMAAIEPGDVGYVEAHGTGTSLGDPIELRALGAVLAAGRPADRPLLVGSVKTNIGHLESAAGVAGLIKTVLALEHEAIPPHLHFHTPNPHVTWEGVPVEVPTRRRPWPRDGRRRVAGVSSFGFSGTNAHVVLEEAPLQEPTANHVDRPAHVLALSARSEAALVDLARLHGANFRAHGEMPLADVCFTAAAGRAQFAHRLAVTGATTEQVASALEAFVAGQAGSGIIRSEAPAEPPEVVFLFTGQGAQYVGMARQLYETQPAFKRALDRVDTVMRSGLPVPLLSVLFDETVGHGRIDETAFTQPALFAVEYALAELWRAWGIEPALVVGHSVGEFAAACVAGVMSLEDAARLIVSRGRLMQALPDGGQMAAVFAPSSAVEPALAARRGGVSVAAINGPESLVISGVREDVEAIRAALAKRGMKSHSLGVSRAFHSPLMAPMLDAFRRVAQTVTFSAPRIGFVSSLTGGFLAPGEVPDADYWCRHVMEPVRFAASMATVFERGHRMFLEIGPHPTLLGMARHCVADESAAVWLPSLRKGKDDWSTMLASVSELYARGATVDWLGFDREYRRRRVVLPTYPFQRRRYWAGVATGDARRSSWSPSGADTGRPLLGRRLHGPIPTFAARFDPRELPVLRDHRVGDALVVAAAVYLDAIAAAAAEVLGEGALVIEQFQIRQPLVLDEEDGRDIRTIVQTTAPSETSVQMWSADPRKAGAWTYHASASVRLEIDGAAATAGPVEGLDVVRARCAEEIAGSDFYARIRAEGIDIGGALAAIQRIWRRDGEALLSLVFPAGLVADRRFTLHPAVLDAAILGLRAAAGDRAKDGDPDTLHVLSGIDRVRLRRGASARLTSHGVIRDRGEAPGPGLTADLAIVDEQSGTVALFEGIRFSRIDAGALGVVAKPPIDEWLYDVEWREAGQLESTSPAAGVLPSPSSIAAILGPYAGELSGALGLGRFDAVLPVLDRACAGYVVRALGSLGFEFRPGGRGDVAELADRLGVMDRHRRLFSTLLEMLEADGILRVEDGGWEVIATPAVDEDPETLCVELIERYPAFAGQARITAACGGQLGAVLRGDVDPLDLLFPEGSFELVEPLYRTGPFAQAGNALVRRTIETALASFPMGRRLSCLEIGAGTGGTSAAVLPAFPADRTEYVYTDLSKLFVTRAAETFRAYPFVRFATLDIERDPLAQGFEAHRFDLILAANVVHATADLATALGHIRRLLAPGGLVVLLEGTEHQRWVDLTFGLLEGWWKFRDHDVRPSYPLLSTAAWRSVLSACGFEEPATVPGDDARQAVIVARAPRPVAEDNSTRPELATREWLLLGHATRLMRRVAEQLVARGAEARVVDSRDDAAAAVTLALTAVDSRDVDVLHFAGLETTSGGDERKRDVDLVQDLGRIATLVRTIAESRSARRVRLWLVTTGAQAPTGLVGEAQPLDASVWGLGRVIALEQPEIWGGLVDLDPRADDSVRAASLIEAIASADGEDQIGVRGTSRYVPRLVRTAPIGESAIGFRADASYLITGGTGGLGVRLARWMAEHGARHLVLTSRHGLPDRSAWDALDGAHPSRHAAAAVVELEARGVTVDVVACDVSDERGMTALIRSFGTSRPALRGVFHAAVAMSTVLARDLDAGTLGSMLAPKIIGTRLLDELTRELDLDCFVLFSSTTALFGVAGLGHYAAANEFMDAIVGQRVARGLPALSVNWGTWDVMRLASEADRRTVIDAGLEPMASAAALDRLGRLIAVGVHRKVVAAVDWSVLKPVYEARRPRPFFADVGPVAVSAAPAPRLARRGATMLPQLCDVPPVERRERLIAWLRSQVASVLDVSASDAISLSQGLFEMGMDSLMSVELKRRLETGLEHPLPSTLTFNYPNIAALAAYLSSEILRLDAEGGDAVSSPARANGSEHRADANGAAEERDEMSEDDLAELLASRLDRLVTSRTPKGIA